MKATLLRQALEGASRVVAATGARQQAKEVRSASSVLPETSDLSVAQFVEQTAAALAELETYRSGAPEDIAVKLRALDGDKGRFDCVVAVLKSCSPQHVGAIAVAYANAPPASVKTRGKAISAIERRFRERAFQASKAKLNERVTPF